MMGFAAHDAVKMSRTMEDERMLPASYLGRLACHGKEGVAQPAVLPAWVGPRLLDLACLTSLASLITYFLSAFFLSFSFFNFIFFGFWGFFLLSQHL